MSDHLALCVDRLLTTESLQSLQGADSEIPSGDSAAPKAVNAAPCAINIDGVQVGHDSTESQEEEPLLQIGECRICQEEDSIQNMEAPCACSGSLKYAHRRCVQQWCNEKGDINCEICHQSYQPGYTAPPPPSTDDAAIDISEIWTISGTPLDLHDPRNLAIVAADRQLLDPDYEYADNNASGATFCRSAALILMALLLLRHAISLSGGDGDDEDDYSAFFSLLLLRVVGFLLPCYIMAWAISILQQRRQRQEAAALAANEVAFMIRAAHQRGLRFTITPAAAMIPAQEPHPPPV